MWKKFIKVIFYSHRKKIFINPKFQWFIIAHFTLSSLGILGVYYLINKYYSQQMQITVGRLLENQNIESKDVITSVLAAQGEFLFLSYLFTAGMIMLAVFMGAFYISHRIAGPLYRMNVSIDDYLLQKKISPVQLRHKDFFFDFADKFNRLLAQLPTEGGRSGNQANSPGPGPEIG